MDHGEEHYRQRMLEELLRAETATNQELRRMHLQWAELYEDRLHPRAARSKPRS